MVRVAIVDRAFCKPDKCTLECIRFCPVNRGKKVKAIELSQDGKHVVINEVTCIGCGICVRKCPFNALSIVNLPDELEKFTVHRYGENMFKLYGLPPLTLGGILGVIGRNGSGKTTSVKILSGQVKPNLGNYSNPPDWNEILRTFRGTEINAYLQKLANGNLRAAVKPQYIEAARRVLKGSVRELLEKADERGLFRELADKMGLSGVMDRNVRDLSGGELQKFLISAVLVKNADAYFFDEPFSYLDVRERVRVASAIREFLNPSKVYVMVVEHDLMILDYVSDYVAVLYGEPGVYGIVSKPYGVRNGINFYLEGYLPAENVRIRKEQIRFRVTVADRSKLPEEYPILKWSNLYKVYPSSGFRLSVEEGEMHPGEVLGILGPNGIGKSTFINMLADVVKPDEGEILIGTDKISYKPQEVSPSIFRFETVKENLADASKDAVDPTSWLYDELTRRLGLNKMLDRKVTELSGGELQKLAVAVTLAREADVYLLDEPSAYLDVEERVSVARLIRRVVEEKRKAAIVVEHDLLFQNYVSDKIMVFTGKPSVEGVALRPSDIRTGFNNLLKQLDVTVRRDPETGRPRINKPGSYLDREQKTRGEYYLPD
ncbi:ABC transporter-like protein [Thermogladius calderae 1633]|uniref:ABC transporter-like protein n=1 Tax=Thermogladius calderae (strain DSM 22663 / VKM B-2946 / 1633) TaxID=1184251 RepID=I3TD52_THEC1|nr:ribosome biogenesis/translation initiation ATPase RLI [Thermogladius calderae]AFK50690.1 ABC transporter-like protein [Thermogladius calderae 1633]